MTTFKKIAGAGSGSFLAAMLSISIAPDLRADTLSDNLSALTAGTEAAHGNTWVTASFATGASAYTLSSATLLLANSAPGNAELDLYSDAGEPGSLLSILTSPASYSGSLLQTIFSGNGFSLSANSIYWLVLKPIGGEFDWAWTASNTGSGVGFTHTWGVSDDAGLDWFTSDSNPMQFNVAASAATAVPEPGCLTLLVIGCALFGGGCVKRKRLASKHRRPTAYSS